jgi:regulation of enolase protein 1 (concanavalin A-like superfamily)
MLHLSSKQVPLGILLALLLTVPVYAGKNYKISNYGGGHQIWFEAEDYDERNPDTAQYYPVVDQAGAFGKAITRAGGAGGMIRWVFDISAAGGKGGTWYFWGRVIDPSNQSDYMLVEGDPDDATIPTGPPFPGNSGTAPFTDADDRVFEQDQASWGWVRSGHEEGHTKVLQNGKNTMRIYHRQGDATVFWDVFMWTDSASYVPTDDDYRNAMVLLPGTASNPMPGAGATDVPRDTALSWEAGKFAVAHDVYFGTAFADVDAATRTDAKGVLASQGQTGTTFDPTDLLAYSQTYYWRIDEANKPSDNKIFKGSVWSFTVEPYGYPVQPVAATASSAQANMGPEKTIDGSGMTGNLHGTDGTTMWLSAGEQPNWIQYEFDQVRKLHDLQVWNSNGEVETFIGFGAKGVTVEISTDGTTWTPVANVPEFSQAPGAAGYAANTTVNLGDADAKFVRLTINTNWGGRSGVTGLSEVRFSYAPMQARGPQPANNAGAVGLSATLDWRPGRDTTSHKVFFGTDQSAVAAGTVAATTVTNHGFDPGTLSFGTFYYWKVDEVGTATYPGSVWSFSTQPYQSVEDFESYTDQKGEEIYSTWIDGLTNGLSNSTVGYLTASGGTFGETRIVHGGKQSMPFEYNNVKTPFYSEAEREFSPLADWTGNGADTLSLWVRGNPAAFVEEGGVVTMSAGGHDVWDNADDFRFAYKALNGNGSITAKVESLVNTNAWAKAGVMIRETLGAGSKHAFFAVTPANSCSAQRREVTDGASASTDWSGAAVTAPYWVRVTRTGNAFKYESSPDGKTWTALGSGATVSMGSNVYIGIAVTSHDASLTTIATVSNVVTTGTVTGAWQAVAIGDDPQPANGPGDFYIAVQDSAGKTATATNPTLVTTATWTQWTIPLSSLSGVNLSKVKKLTVGVGDRASPKAGGAGKLYIDDIGFGKPLQWVAQLGESLIEAESATSITAPMAISYEALASGGKYIGTPTTQADSSTDPPTTGIAQIPFTVPGGKYKLLFRVLIPGDNNSVWVRIADGTTQTNNHASGWVRFNDIAAGETWHWDEVHSSDDGNQVVEWTLAAGTHTLEIAYREAGAQVDVIVIQSLN